MDKNINLSFFRLQADGSWADEAEGTPPTVSLAKDGTMTTNAIALDTTTGIIQIQVKHASAGSATLTGTIFESVDGIDYLVNGTGFCTTLAKATTLLYTHDAKANRFIKLFFEEDNVAATEVTLSVAVR